jgi:hypothetical protein
MIKFILFICFLVFCLNSLSQEIILTNPRHNKFYTGIDNPLYAMVEGYPCRSVILTTENGSIEKTSCYYSFHPAKFGVAKIQIKIKNGKTITKIKEETLHIDSFPLPIAYIGGLSGGHIKAGALEVQGGVGAGLEPSFGFELTYEVESFTTIIIRKDSVVFCRKNNRNGFEIETKGALKNLQKDDTVLFTRIVCKGPDNLSCSLKPLEFSIIE